MHSVPISTKVVSSNPVHGKVSSIHNYVVKFVSVLWQVSGFLRVLWYPPSIKLTPMIYNVTEVLLKVTLYTINQPTYAGLYTMPCVLPFVMIIWYEFPDFL